MVMLMTFEMSDPNRPIWPDIRYLENTAKTQQEALKGVVPVAKNSLLQDELVTIFSIYKKILADNIANLQRQIVIVTKRFSPPFYYWDT